METTTYYHPTLDPQISTEDNVNCESSTSKLDGALDIKIPITQKLQNLESRLTFFHECKRHYLIPKGFQRHFWLANNVNNYSFVDLIQRECNVQASRLFDIFINNLEDYLKKYGININSKKS